MPWAAGREADPLDSAPCRAAPTLPVSGGPSVVLRSAAPSSGAASEDCGLVRRRRHRQSQRDGVCQNRLRCASEDSGTAYGEQRAVCFFAVPSPGRSVLARVTLRPTDYGLRVGQRGQARRAQDDSQGPGLRFRTTRRPRTFAEEDDGACAERDAAGSSRVPGSTRHPEQTETLTLIHLAMFWLRAVCFVLSCAASVVLRASGDLPVASCLLARH